MRKKLIALVVLVMFYVVPRGVQAVAGVWSATRFVPGVHCDGPCTLLRASGLMFALVLLARPLVALQLVVPYLTTLGAVSVVVNGGLFWTVAFMVPGFHVDSVRAAAIAGSLLTALSLATLVVTFASAQSGAARRAGSKASNRRERSTKMEAPETLRPRAVSGPPPVQFNRGTRPVYTMSSVDDAPQETTQDRAPDVEAKVAAVLRLFAGEAVVDVSRESGVAELELLAWRTMFVTAGRRAFEDQDAE